MAYSKKVIQKFEDTLREPEKHSVGRWDPTDSRYWNRNGRSTCLRRRDEVADKM